MAGVCKLGQAYAYPQGSLIRPYIKTYYDWTGDFRNKVPYLILLNGNVKCRGYQGNFRLSQEPVSVTLSIEWVLVPSWDSFVCSSSSINRNSNSSIKYDDDCWKDSLTFNGHPYAVVPVICPSYRLCISQYRVNDGFSDCWNNEDESVLTRNKDSCSRVRKYRFQCSPDQPTCFMASKLGDGVSQCSNNYDEYFYGSGRALSELQCRKSDLVSCQLLREYIKTSSLASNSTMNLYSNTSRSQYQSTSQIPFRSYCDSFWNLPKHIDERTENCQSWICHEDQYQCQTGQCIPLDWVCDGQWDCADASDEEAIHIIQY